MDSRITRREFLKKTCVAGSSLALGGKLFANTILPKKKTSYVQSVLFRVLNDSPWNNLEKSIEMMGGIKELFGIDDIVVIKPNVQWWNQGAPNLSAIKRFIDLIMDRPGGFRGEVVIAENCHRGAKPWNAAGWAHRFEWNSDLKNVANMNELSALLKKQYGNRLTICHWIDVDAVNKRVYGPDNGIGYVYCDGTGGVPLISYDNGLRGQDYRSVIMTYPIFKTDTGTIVDFKNGIWEKGSYTKQPLKYINFAALNHHSTYSGATSAVKNYLGISDLSGGADPHNGGKLVGDFFNFHSFPFDEWSHGPKPGMLGGEIGVFMNTIRKADLNITTAEWIGLASRVTPPMVQTRAVLASTDPVALDYHATKYLLYPNSRLSIHNPDNQKEPLHHYLSKCAEEGGGIFDEQYVDVKSYDMKSKSFQSDDDLVIIGEKIWGKDIKGIMKYLFLRYV